MQTSFLLQNHMLFEILKNSLRATVETHGAECENFPPIKVIVAEGSDDITIKISDEVGFTLCVLYQGYD
jgi:pyruvate dehydrogenase kinase 2/3/4